MTRGGGEGGTRTGAFRVYELMKLIAIKNLNFSKSKTSPNNTCIQLEHCSRHHCKRSLFISTSRAHLMGASSSKQHEAVCINCDKKTQRDLPDDNNSSASKGNPCEISYVNVTACMDENNGQVSSCIREWDEFKECHSRFSRK